MKDLKCGLINCHYNKGYSCCSREISVNNCTDCTTYSPDPEKRENMFEAGEDFTPANYSVDTKVRCMAPCVFQRGNACIANGITVMREDDEAAVCLTFMRS